MASDLAPGFLVAAPSLLDPNFAQTVVLLVDHRAEGSLGFIVNRPADITFDSVAEELGLGNESQPAPDMPVLVGGPVAPHTGWIVFDPSQSTVPHDDTIEVSSHLRVSASRELLEAIAKTDRADRHMLVLGYAGWGSGQLDEEIRQGAWIPVDLDERVVFDTPYDGRWDAALSVLGIDPRLLVSGSIPQA
ncbi:MAG: YqgE/AlgH family protein [Deltaproteobacteria bacterium]|jgi:putative transcriptional regulator